MNAKLTLSLVVAAMLAACGGGGSDQVTDPSLLYSGNAAAGSFNASTDSGYTRVQSFAWTNTTNEPMMVRVEMEGKSLGAGQCDCYASLMIAIPRKEGTYTDSNTARTTGAWTDATRYVDAQIPAGATITGEVLVGYYNGVGSTTVQWSDFTVSLHRK